MIEVKKIDKTIIIPYEDCNRMIQFCKTDGGAISKDFYDWYLKEDKPEFFIKSGMLIVDKLMGLDELLPFSFDFEDPNEALFTSYIYSDQSKVCQWKFHRMDNLTMEKISFDVVYTNATNAKKFTTVLLSVPKGESNAVEFTKNRILDKVHHKIDLKTKKGFRAPSNKELIAESKREASKLILKMLCEAGTYFIYALMYYVSKQEPEVIESQYTKIETTDAEKIKSFYKYTGYVDLRENRVYKPVIKRDPDIPAREYQRHIQAWTVRGHYRKTSNGLIWIEPHIKGKGELEKRIYGMEDEKDLNIIPKVFEVEKVIKTAKNDEPVNSEVKQDVRQEVKIKKPGIIRRIINFLFKHQ